MNEEIFKKKNKLKENLQLSTNESDEIIFENDDFLDYNINTDINDIFSQEISAFFNDEINNDNDEEQDKSIVPDHQSTFNNSTSIINKRKEEEFIENKEKENLFNNKKQKLSIENKNIINNDTDNDNYNNDNQLSITLLNENENEIENINELTNTNEVKNINETTILNETEKTNNEIINMNEIENKNKNDESENDESENDEIENENGSPINILNNENQYIEVNDSPITSNEILYNNYRKRHSDKYTLYDSDDEEDKMIIERILSSEKYEKVKNYLSSYHMEDIINAIEKNENKKQYNDHNSHQYYVIYLIDIYHISNYDMEIGNDIIQGFKNDIKKYFECATLTLLQSYLFKTNMSILNLKKKLTFNIRFKNIPSTDMKYYTFICDNPSCKRYKVKKMLHQNYNYSFTSNGIEVQPNIVLISTLKTNQELVEHNINQSYIPKSISFFLKLNLSPFAFTQRLIDYFCEDIVPSSMYRKTKLMMLLSLVSTPSDPKISFQYLIEWEKNSFQFISEKLHLMFVMDDYHPLFLRLIESAQKMRRNHDLLKENNKYQPLIEISTTTDKNIKLPSFIDGGSLCYAKDGILKIPFSNLTPKEVKHVVSVINDNVNIPIQGSQIECFVPFVNTTIIWGLYDLQYLNIKNKKGKTTIKYIKDCILKDTDTFSINFSNFNLYSYMRVQPDENFDKLTCEDIIESICVMEKENDKDGEKNQNKI
eukprot:jgi/Orpsp1_1/1184263/evm.model.c7180000088773.2